MPKSKNFLILVIFITLFCWQFLSNAFAENFGGHYRGQYFDWTLFSNQQGKDTICYLLAIPVQKSSGVQNRGEPYFIITKTTNNIAEISVSPGYFYQKDSEAELSFGLRKFNLLTYKTQAWTYQGDDDIEIIKVMKNSDDIVVNSISTENEISRDTYSLIGFNKALDEMQRICR